MSVVTNSIGATSATAAGAVARRGLATAGLEEVGLTIGDERILEDVTITVGPGEALCLVGPSGGGKSTILNLLAGLVRPTTGRVVFDGVPVDGPSPERAVVFQDAALFPWLTLEKNIAFPLEVLGVGKDERKARVLELLRLVHLSKFGAMYPHELSGGMRQRGAIARALAARPRMILFDEPFAALDGQMRELLQSEVERLVGASRTTMVFVTHQIDEAVRLGDRVVLVGARPGRIVGEVQVDLPRPRVRDARAMKIAERIADEIRDEVEKVAREEADGAWGIEEHDGEARSARGGRRGDPRRHLGGGI